MLYVTHAYIDIIDTFEERNLIGGGEGARETRRVCSIYLFLGRELITAVFSSRKFRLRYLTGTSYGHIKRNSISDRETYSENN